MRRLLITLSVVGALIGWSAPAQADGSYAPNLPTSCNITAEALAGERVRIRVEVTSNSTDPVAGELAVALFQGRPTAGNEIWSTTARYEGESVRLVGPRIGGGHYVVRLEFTPDDGQFSGCAARAAVNAAGPADAGDPDAAGLPNTGGPHLLLLLAGLGLVAAGGGVVARTRRTA